MLDCRLRLWLYNCCCCFVVVCLLRSVFLLLFDVSVYAWLFLCMLDCRFCVCLINACLLLRVACSSGEDAGIILDRHYAYKILALVSV